MKMPRAMSRAIKRKHVLRELFEDDFELSKPNQQIVRVSASRGNYLLEVATVDGSKFLISIPTKFRNTFWVKRGDYVLIELIGEGKKMKGKLVRILTHGLINYYKKDNVWPSEFDNNMNKKSNESSEDDYYKLTANMNRLQFHCNSDGEDSESEDNSEDEEYSADNEDSEDEDDTEINDETSSDKEEDESSNEQ